MVKTKKSRLMYNFFKNLSLMKNIFSKQFLPNILTVLTFFILATLLYALLLIIDFFPLKQPVVLDFRNREILFGILVYLKTAIDFAIFIGNLMHTNPGWKKRVAIALGTSIGNSAGTFLILSFWTIFSQIPFLMIIMIFVASVVLFKMAEESLENFLEQKRSFTKLDLRRPVTLLQQQLDGINQLFRPILRFFVPSLNLTRTEKLSFTNLVVFSFTIPFVLGLDNFSAYIPFYASVNVFGFTLGILLGHMLLTIGLFSFPGKTVAVVKHPLVLMVGGVAFVGLGIYGLYKTILLFLDLVRAI